MNPVVTFAAVVAYFAAGLFLVAWFKALFGTLDPVAWFDSTFGGRWVPSTSVAGAGSAVLLWPAWLAIWLLTLGLAALGWLAIRVGEAAIALADAFKEGKKP